MRSKRRSRLGWAIQVVAPWGIAMGLVVTATAKADREPDPSERQFAAIPMSGPRLGPSIDLSATGSIAASQLASLTIGQIDEPPAEADEIEPQISLKAAIKSALVAPTVNRAGKGDPFISLRPGLDARRAHAPLEKAENAGSVDPEAPELSRSPGVALIEGQNALSAPGRVALQFEDGATPAVPLEHALATLTPTSSDGLVHVVATRPNPPVQITVAKRDDAPVKSHYASLIDPRDATRQMRCLAEAIYFESRSEPEPGQAAVAQVVLNRVRSGLYPANICGVVYQDRNHPFACQFSFACEGKSLRIEEPGPWSVATRIARTVVAGEIYNPRVGEALNYHANYVRPYWASTLRRVDRIGNHIFYQPYSIVLQAQK